MLREKDTLAHGMRHSLTHAEIDLLYKDQADYRAEVFLVDAGEQSVSTIRALLDGAIYFIYVSKLRAILEAAGFPVDHLPQGQRFISGTVFSYLLTFLLHATAAAAINAGMMPDRKMYFTSS